MTLTDEARQLLTRIKIGVPEGITAEAAQEKVLKAVVRKLIMQAHDAGVSPSYTEWLGLPEYERACWEQINVEKRQLDWAMYAAACGNTGMARKALHIDDPEAQLDDAIEIGLRKVGLA